MTKQILIFAYILIVLLISGMVRASEDTRMVGHAVVQSAEVNPATGILTVHGILPNPCNTKPMLSLDRVDWRSLVIVMDVATTVESEACIQTLGEKYDIAYDLKELQLDENQTYSVVFLHTAVKGDVTYLAKRPREDFSSYRTHKQAFKGTLVSLPGPASVALDGSAQQTSFALSKDGQMIRVVSPDLDLNSFTGPVYVLGYAIETASLYGQADDNLALGSQDETVIVPVAVARIKP